MLINLLFALLVLVAYFLYYMGFVGQMVASRVVYLGAVLFLGSGLIGISHNFYWNGKSIGTVALGSVFSTLQFLPLILLSIEAWKFRNLPGLAIEKNNGASNKIVEFGMSEAFLFLIGVNFWNFVGAGLFGFIINLPIVNYYQHGTYLTVNHGHAAMFGVYGNLAIAAVLFCTRWMVKKEAWNPKLLRLSFWSLNGGLFLMVIFDLFPIGLHQLMTVIDQGYAFARSQAYLDGAWFQILTWFRGIGTMIFVLTGVLSLTYFVMTLKLNRHTETKSDA